MLLIFMFHFLDGHLFYESPYLDPSSGQKGFLEHQRHEISWNTNKPER